MIKIEPVNNDDDSSDDTFLYKPNKETHRQEVKQERELIIDADVVWLPSKIEDEQHEYYHQYQHIDNDEIDGFIISTIKSEPEYEEFIDEGEFINDNYTHSNDFEYNIYNYEHDHDIDDENEDSQSSDNDFDQSGYRELIENPGYCKDERDTTKDVDNLEDSTDRSNSETFCKKTFMKWLRGNYIQHMCPVCSKKFKTFRLWSQHINSQHQDMIEGAKTNFHINEKSRAICKLCSNRQFNMDFQILIHSLRHAPQNTVKFFICNICNFESNTSMNVLNHIMAQHPQIEQLFKKRKIEPKNVYECPLCPSTYQKCGHLCYHFLDNHQKEFWEKCRYQCHICEDKTKFDIDEEYFKHLFEKHNLKDLKILNFTKHSENPDEHYYSCTKCFKIFTEMNFIKFLKHYLEHDAKSYWFCKFCSRKISFSKQSYYHVCPKMIKTYKKRIVISKTEEENTPSSSASHIKQEKKKLSNWKESPALHIKQEKKKLSNWQEFEDYIIHVCPFCNTEFDTLKLWQMYLRKLHQIDTLKGLEMETIAENPNKLQCQICNTLVINTSIQLHTHRFQHLPYKPYKCRHCSKTLNNYSIALTHVLNQCQEDNKDKDNKEDPTAAIKTFRESHEISCSFCQNQKFADDASILQHFEDKHNNFLEFFCQQPDNSMICNLCEHQFAVYNKNICISHIIQHLDQKTYKCLLCSQSYHSNQGIWMHLKRTHHAKATKTQKKYSHSQETHTSLPKAIKKGVILKEFIEFINLACPECNEIFANQQLLHDHINNTHNLFDKDNLDTEDPSDSLLKCQHFICNLCNHSTSTLGVIYRHLRKLHFNKGSYKCPICSVVSITSYEASEHIKKTHPQSEWPATMCSVCYKTLNSRREFTSHMLKHDINRKKFESKYAGAKLSNMEDLHENRNEKIDKSQKNSDLQKEKSSALNEFIEFINFACPECNESFANQQLWHDHINNTHNLFDKDNLGVVDPLDGILKCQHCQLKVTCLAHQRKHLLTHMPYRSFICNICYHGCSSLGALYAHLRIFHFNKGSYKCPICPVVSITSYEESEHIKKTHPQSEWPATMCSVCYKTFDSKKELTNHMIKHDINQKKIECQKLSNMEDLKMHEKIDKSQKNSELQKVPTLPMVKTDKSYILKEFIKFINFACPECNESFTNQQLWHDHINNTHNFFDIDKLGVVDPLDGILKCQHCQIKVTCLAHQRKHILTHMPYRSFICNLCYQGCNSLGILYGHLRRLHFSKGKYKCPICPIVSTTSYEGSEHIKKTHPQSEWPATMCLVCYKNLSTRQGLNTHMITHDVNRPKYECKYCSAKLCDMKDLKIHVARHEKNMEQTGESDQNNDDDDDDNSKSPNIDNDGITDINFITNYVKQEHNIDADDHKQNEGTVHSLFNNSTNNNTEAEKLIKNEITNEILNTDDVKVEIIKTFKSENKDNKNMSKAEKRKLIIEAVRNENKSNGKRKKLK